MDICTAEKKDWIPGDYNYRWFWATSQMLGIQPGSWEEQVLLTTTPSLWPQESISEFENNQLWLIHKINYRIFL